MRAFLRTGGGPCNLSAKAGSTTRRTRGPSFDGIWLTSERSLEGVGRGQMESFQEKLALEVSKEGRLRARGVQNLGRRAQRGVIASEPLRFRFRNRRAGVPILASASFSGCTRSAHLKRSIRAYAALENGATAKYAVRYPINRLGD